MGIFVLDGVDDVLLVLVFVLGVGDDGVVAVLLRHLLFMGTVMLFFDYTLGKAYYSIQLLSQCLHMIPFRPI